MIIFSTERLSVREIKSDDLEILLDLYKCQETMHHIPNSDKEWDHDLLWEKYTDNMKYYPQGYGIFTVIEKSSGEIIGEAGLFNSFDNPSILELGYIINKGYWNKGLGTELSRGLIDYAFNKLHVEKIITRMFATNIGSIKVSEKCGMKLDAEGITADGDAFKSFVLKAKDYCSTT
ncbi:N-acetyltransferase [Puteibacter caeruleilacunae]|nr:N-acetyltransferase [Puteibacter caeruleilacunae]